MSILRLQVGRRESARALLFTACISLDLAACGARPPSSVAAAPSIAVVAVPSSSAVAASSSSAPAPSSGARDARGSARWSPELEDIVSMRGELTAIATLEWCPVRGTCHALLRLTPHCEVLGTQEGPSRERLFVWHRCERGEHTLDIYDMRDGQRTGRASIGGGAALSPITSSELRWTDGGNILLNWGAGSNVALAELYDIRGREILNLSVDSLAVSPSVRYLATFPGPYAPMPEPLNVYDLTTGKVVMSSPGNVREVRTLRWEKRRISVRLQELDGHVRTTSIHLDGQP